MLTSFLLSFNDDDSIAEHQVFLLRAAIDGAVELQGNPGFPLVQGTGLVQSFAELLIRGPALG